MWALGEHSKAKARKRLLLNYLKTFEEHQYRHLGRKTELINSKYKFIFEEKSHLGDSAQ